jgi:NAD+ synthase (glutamine-hydrolysing)
MESLQLNHYYIDLLSIYILHLSRKSFTVIPQNILIKPPSAELRPDQKDEDTLPPYPVLDAILHMYLHENASVEGMVARGYERQTVCSILNMVHRMEYKRKQAPLTLKVFSPAVHGGRKNPIVQKYSWL